MKEFIRLFRSPIFSGECSEELAAHICDPCPDPNDREFGRVRSAGFIFSDYIATLMVNPLLNANWVTGIKTGKIIVIPETAGNYDPGTAKELPGYGDRAKSYGPRTMTLNFKDPNLVSNYPHYNGLGGQSELIPFFRTSSQLRIFDKPAIITASDPVEDDIESEVTWNVSAVVVSNNLPSYHAAATLVNTIFKCSYLNNINVDPVVNAGADQAITLPTNNVNLVGSATDDGTIATYLWSKVSGPAGSTFATPNAAGTAVSGLVEGTYVFRLTATDNDGATGTDDVQITVNPALVAVVYGYQLADPYVNDTTAPAVGSPQTINIQRNANIVFSLPAAAADKYWVVKVPAAESAKITWYHNINNNGTVGDAVVRAAFTVAGFTYYVTRAPFVLTVTDTIQLRS